MNFLDHKSLNGRAIRPGDLVRFNRYSGNRKMNTWIGYITAVKAHKLKVFLPAENSYDWIRNNVIQAFILQQNDMTLCLGQTRLLEASSVIKKLTKEYYAGKSI